MRIGHRHQQSLLLHTIESFKSDRVHLLTDNLLVSIQCQWNEIPPSLINSHSTPGNTSQLRDKKVDLHLQNTAYVADI